MVTKRIAALALGLGLAACDSQAVPRVLLVDQNAGPNGTGAIFALSQRGDTWQARRFACHAAIARPQDILAQPDGSYLVLDYCGEKGDGKLFRLSADGARCAEVELPPGLVDPVSFERAADGSIWIVDKNADPLGRGKQHNTPTGTLWRLTADLSTLEVLASGPPLRAPSALVIEGDNAWLLDADSYRTEPYQLANGEGAIFRVHPGKQQPLEPIVRFKDLISPFDMHRLSTGEFLVIDVNCDPVERSKIHGAVYLADPKSGKTTLFANHADFRDPARCLEIDGKLWIVDANADPLDLGPDGSAYHFGGKGRGGIYALDTSTKKIELVLAAKEFVNPIRLRMAPR